MAPADDPRVAFIRAATWHGTLDEADAILAAHPRIAGADIHVAAILGDEAAVRRWLERDPAAARAPSAPYGASALVHLCLSNYLRLDPARSDAFVRAATALLDAGADPNGGFRATDEYADWESALYGAAGVAHHAGLTRLLLERGADPNDIEAVYHSPESHDNAAMQALVETGKVRTDNLSVMLVRKHDWHDLEGARWLVDHGANPNLPSARGWLPLHHALMRDNSLDMIALLLDHGADPAVAKDGMHAAARAARRGRGDVLALFARRGVAVPLHGADRLIAACAAGDDAAVSAMATGEPQLVGELRKMGGDLLAQFAGTGNAPGVSRLLDLGVDAAAPFTAGDLYHDEPPGSLAIHVAAWRARAEVVKVLIANGSPVDVPDPKGRTPLALAVRACVDSYWSERATPETAAALLAAGASPRGISYPTGRADLDRVLARGAGTV